MNLWRIVLFAFAVSCLVLPISYSVHASLDESSSVRGKDSAETTASYVNNSYAGGIGFIENVGQFAPGARFQIQSSHGTYYLAKDAIWVTLLEKPSSPTNSPQTQWQDSHTAPGNADHSVKRVNLKLTFAGANAHPVIEPFDRLPSHVSYFYGSDPKNWHANVPVWGGVRYKELYPGIDLEMTLRNGQVRKQIVAHGNADPSTVHLRIKGADAIMLERGFVVVSTTMGNYKLPLFELDAQKTQALPSPAIVGTRVDSPYSELTVASKENALEASTALLYSTFLGGIANNNATSTVVDSNGGIYVGGYTSSTDFPTKAGSYDTTFNGYVDAFLVKLQPNGNGSNDLVFSTFLGGTAFDGVFGLVVKGNGLIYMTGNASSGFPTTSGAFDTTYDSNGGDGFIAKLDPTGSTLIYSTYLDNGHGEGIAVDATGLVYVTGSAYSHFPTTSGAYDTTFNTNNFYQNAFVAKLNPAGNGQSDLLYGTFLGGTGDIDGGSSIAVNAGGKVFVSGHTSSSDFPTTPGAYDTTWGGGSCGVNSTCSDLFIAKLNLAGSGKTDLLYSTFFGGNKDDGGGIVLDANDTVYVSGSTESSDFPTTPGAYDVSYNGGSYGDDVFIAKLNLGGNGVSDLRYSTFFGGTGDDFGSAPARDSTGAIYVTGETTSTNLPTTQGAFDTSYAGDSVTGYNGGDAFLIKLNPIGSGKKDLKYSTFMGGRSAEDGHSVFVDPNGTVYVAGYTGSKNFPTTSGAFDTSCNACAGNTGDGFLSKLSTGPILVNSIVAEARKDFGMPYSTARGCSSDFVGCGGPYHGFYKGVCTDLVLDAYAAGVSYDIHDAMVQDHKDHPTHYYRHGAYARNSDDMWHYFTYSGRLLSNGQPYQVGDIAFFDWNGGAIDHVDVISEVDKNGQPVKIADAGRERAAEYPWSSYYADHVQGHARLTDIAVALLTSANTSFQSLRVTVDTPDVALSMQDPNGKQTSSIFDEELLASNNESFIPYIPGAEYADLGASQVISVTQPLSNATQYFVTVTGIANTSYNLTVETLQDGVVTSSNSLAQSIAAGETYRSSIQLSAPGDVITFVASSFASAPLLATAPDVILMAKQSGAVAQATITVSETGGQLPANGVSLVSSDLTDQWGNFVEGSHIAITPASFDLQAGASHNVLLQLDVTGIQPGVYQGNLQLTFTNGTPRSIPVTLAILSVENQDQSIQYDGWRGVTDAGASEGSYRTSNVKNETVRFKFQGKSVKWISRKGPDQGKALITIDGVSRGTIDLYSSTIQSQFTKTFKGLADTKHTIVIKVLGAKYPNATDTYIAVDGFIVGKTTTQQDSSSISYNKWSAKSNANASGGAYRITKKSGADAKFTFTGTSVDWITAKGPAYGKAQVLIDGVDQGYFDLYETTQQWQAVVSFNYLSDAQHVIEIKPLGTKNGNSSGVSVILDAFRGPFTGIGD